MTDEQHARKIERQRRYDARKRAERPIRSFVSDGYPLRLRLQRILAGAKFRCRYRPRYAGRGIQCQITYDDLMFIWQRDKADDMARPSLDRIDNDGHYTRDNIRFVELYDNISAGTRIRESLRDHARQSSLT